MRGLLLITAVAALGWLVADSSSAYGQGTAARPRRTIRQPTAPPPEWRPSELAVFFENAVEHLGPGRPGSASASSSSVPSEESAPPTPEVAWSTRIEASTLEDEVKAASLRLNQAVANPSVFRGGAFKDARRDFSVAAILFGVIVEYDGSVRWQAEAVAMRDALARAGRNAKVGTDASYAEASQRAQELAELVRGASPEFLPAEESAGWAAAAQRPPLMQRMQIGLEERLKPWTGQAREFERHRRELAHEAQLLAVMAEVLQDEEYEYADDETFLEHLAEFEQQVNTLAQVLAANDVAGVQGAVSRISQACDRCHGDFR